MHGISVNSAAMSARYRAYTQRLAGVMEFERVTTNDAGGGVSIF